MRLVVIYYFCGYYLKKTKYEYGKELENGNRLVSVWNRQSIADSDLSPEAYSNIFTDVLERNGFDTSKLENGKVTIVKLEYNSRGDGPAYESAIVFNHENTILYKDADVAEEKTKETGYQVTAYIHPTESSDREYLSTVSNVVSVLGVHELTGHGIKDISYKRHGRILQIQKNHPSWKKISPKLRDLYDYLSENKPEYRCR